MKMRPTSVTVVSWILIVLGVISLIATTALMNNPKVVEVMRKNALPVNVQHAISYFSVLVSVVSGIVMLMGQNWGRFLYVGWSIIGFVIGFITSPARLAMIPGFVVFLILTFFLFRPKANEYFAKSEPAAGA